MPLYCPKDRLKYNACLDCFDQWENKCHVNSPFTQNLADILTDDERISILEDKPVVPKEEIIMLTHEGYEGLQRSIKSLRNEVRFLKEKLESHIDKTTERGGDLT